MFNMDDKVTTPSGTGYVCYVEDDYIEVDVKGVEMGFHAPFEHVKPYDPKDDLPKPTQAELDDAKYEDVEIPYGVEVIGKMQHNMATLAVAVVGGDALSWDELPTRIKLNYVCVGMGWKDADEAVEKMKNQDL